MKKLFNLTSSFKALSDEDGTLRIRGLASTSDVDRAGDIVEATAWTKGGLNNFQNNPIILFNHDYDRPIGKATSLEVKDNGLEMEAVISKAAAGGIYDLIKDGVLGAFSVGFRIKDADVVEGTNGIMVKDAELFEVSVVSVPCNQGATFSVAKSFDSESDYNEFVQSFSANLAGQELAKNEDNSSDVASNAPEGGDIATDTEFKMSDINIDEIAQKAAEKAAAALAMKQAEEAAAKKAADEEAARKAAEAEEAKAAAEEVVVKSLQSGTEKLVEDFQKQLNERDAKFDEVIAKFNSQLEEKAQELDQLRTSKMVFDQNGVNQKEAVKKNASELLKAHMFNVVTGKNWDNDFSKEILEKAGVDYTVSAADIDQEVSSQIEKEVMLELKVAPLFREIQVNGFATVLPLQPDVNRAIWAADASGHSTPYSTIESRDNPTADTFTPEQVILNAYRLISTTYMHKEVDEQVLINIMPMLVESTARAHARAVDAAILFGNGAGITGIGGYADVSADTLSIGGNAQLTADLLLNMRQGMGKYGMSPRDIVYIVSQKGYYDLLDDPKFQTLDEVGSDLAVRVTGTLGAVYGTPVVASDEFADPVSTGPCAYAVNTRNYVIPRLRGVLVEQDYEVKEQRRVIVGSQNLGFTELFGGAGTQQPSVRINYAV